MGAKFKAGDAVRYPADGVDCTGVVVSAAEFEGEWYYSTKEQDGTECNGLPEWFMAEAWATGRVDP